MTVHSQRNACRSSHRVSYVNYSCQIHKLALIHVTAYYSRKLHREHVSLKLRLVLSIYIEFMKA